MVACDISNASASFACVSPSVFFNSANLFLNVFCQSLFMFNILPALGLREIKPD